MNIYSLHAKIINDFSPFIKSFLNIKEERIKEVVDEDLEKGSLWPHILTQCNPWKSIPYEVQVGMFAPEKPVVRNKEVTINSSVEVNNLTQGKTFQFIITADEKSGQQVIGHQNIKITSQMALAMINRKVEEWEIKTIE